VHAIRVEFLTRLYFIHAIAPERLEITIAEQEDEILRGINRLQDIRSKIPSAQVFNVLGLDLRIQQLESLINWLSDCRNNLGRKMIINSE
jgi:hypothetical protein